jgi:NAD(P)-dependent dehydrogenase (short-subunit alcohol dehydrogenase family)
MAYLKSSNPEDQVWFITGTSTGFGRLLAETLMKRGTRVVATARRVDDIDDFSTRYPGQAVILPLDVTDSDSIQHAHDDALAHMGRVDVLVNNAGYGVTGAIEEVTEDEYMRMFNTNVFGLIELTRAFLPELRAQHSGHIVNVSSIGGLIGSPGWGYYNSTKFAVEGLSQALRGEVEPLGIGVTVIEPGPFRTDFLGRSGVEAKARIADYEPTAGKTREYFTTQAGRQPGDPQKAVEAIIAAVNAPKPPKNLLLGKLALTRYRDRLSEIQGEIAAWEETTNGADFPEGANTLTAPPYGKTEEEEAESRK